MPWPDFSSLGGTRSSMGPNSITDDGAMNIGQFGGIELSRNPNGVATGALAGNSGLGLNLNTGQLALQGLGTIGGLYSAWQANSLAKEQFGFQKRMAETNLTNQLKTFNMSMEDRLRSRGAYDGADAGTTQAEIERRRLTR